MDDSQYIQNNTFLSLVMISGGSQAEAPRERVPRVRVYVVFCEPVYLTNGPK